MTLSFVLKIKIHSIEPKLYLSYPEIVLGNVGSDMENYTERELVIDLSETKNTAQLATELSSILESNETKGKDVCLNLGSLELKQSQLLSIKALIESIESSVSSIVTESEMTEASAVSLGITIKSVHADKTVSEELPFHDTISEHIDDLNDTFSTVSTADVVNTENQSEPDEESKEDEAVECNPNVQAAFDKVMGNQFNDSKDDIVKTNIELIEPGNIDRDFEISETRERSSEGKYVLLDTEGITPEDMEENSENTSELQTLYLTQTLRSGQTVSYEGNIFIVGDTHPGSEVIATGDITVWGILGGIAHAGSDGNVSAKVRALKLNPIQLRIAGLYSRRNDTINVPYIQRTNEFTPEEARINNKQIVVYKTLRRED